MYQDTYWTCFKKSLISENARNASAKENNQNKETNDSIFVLLPPLHTSLSHTVRMRTP